MNSELKKELSTLELGGLASIIEKQEHDISLIELSYNERIDCLLSEVITLRKNNLIGRLIKNANLKYPSASLESLDCEARELDRNKIINLASMGFMSAATNLIITGPAGAGKTYLASVFGIEACRQTLRTCYVRMPDMLAHIHTHRDNLKEQVRFRKKLGNYKLLIIDEWLNYKINDRESKFIYELIEHRCGNTPTIFVGQYGISDWHERLGGGTQADSIMDRIIHNSYEIPSSDNNLRKLYDSEKAQRVIESLEK